MNPATAFGTVFADELARCGLREAVVAPGSRSTPLAMALHDLERAGRLRLHVRIDERSASFTALGLAKASRRPVAVLCTSGTAAANFHPAVIEAGESGVPLLVLTADRPPELRAVGASQTIDQVKLYGEAVRWFADAGVPETRPGAVGYWRSLACQAWAHAAGQAGTFPGPVHVNLPFRDPLVPDGADGGSGGPGGPEPLGGRPDGRPWTRFTRHGTGARPLALPWAERGIVVCGDGDYDAAPLLELAERAGWPVLAEPSSGARRGPNALAGYQYLLASKAFMAAHRPEVIVSAGRPGLSRPQSALLALAGAGEPVRHVVVAQGPGHWADPQRAATDLAAAVRLTGAPAPGAPDGWLGEWRRADADALRAACGVLDAEAGLTEPLLARELLAALPAEALLWAGNSLSVRDIDECMRPRRGVRVLASRGASGIDGTVSSAIGAALAHGGPAFALIGDLAFLHDTAGLAIGPEEPRPDLCLVVVNNDGGGIFAGLEQAAFPGVFRRMFGTPHGASLSHLAAAFGVPYTLAQQPGDLAKAGPGSGLRVIEARTDGAANADLRARMRAAAVRAVEELLRQLEVGDRADRQRLRVGHAGLVALEVPGVVDGRQVRPRGRAGAGRHRRGGRGEVALHHDQVHRRVVGDRRLVRAASEIHRPVIAHRGDVDPPRVLVAVAPGHVPGDLRQLLLGRRGHAPRGQRGPARGKAGEGQYQHGGEADRGAAGGR
jgi:2-succinyl-5-enolpyruvyl-6-hydroxy-3-cyclohexene-1-carboxylate synthase